MKTVNLTEESLDLAAVLDLARQEPVLLLAPDGKEFVLSEADDFEREVEILRQSPAFQRFLEERSKAQGRIPLEEIERELEQELSKQEPA
jgi:PHD/YefM family antitoxin component YafN of YafNO toxin-antitoxin module